MKKRLPSREVVTAIAGALAEWLFAVVPFVVLSIVFTHRGHGSVVLESSEWSFGASVLAGQGLVRFVSGIAKAKYLSVDRVLLGVSALFVFVVVPANIILALVLVDQENNKPISSLLATGQFALFFIASLLFIVAASFSHLWSKRTVTP
jgi:uncharacterized membrane protein